MYSLCILKKDIQRGEKITQDMVDTVMVDLTNNFDLTMYYNKKSLNTIIGNISNNDYKEGELLLKSMLVNEQEYLSANKEKEIISLKLTDGTDSVSYKIRKGNIVNIYYTGKSNQAEGILNLNSIENVASSSKTDGFTSILLLENMKIIDVFDKYGNKMDYSKIKSNDNTLIDTIVIEVDRKNALKINNLKNYGKFSVSIIK